MNKVLFYIPIFLLSFNIQAQPVAPLLHIDSEGLQVDLHWSEVDSAVGYRLFYAPYPYQGEQSVNSINMGAETEFAIKLWQGAAFYVALQAYDIQNQSSEYSNIGFLQIQDRGASYRQYWRTITKEISEKSLTSNDFLYALLPNIADCFSGALNEQAQLRLFQALNQTRELHRLSATLYDSNANLEVQEASLIQRANNSLSHTPSTNATCYSDAGFDGSSSSNLHLGGSNSDPASDLIGLVDDAFNQAAIEAVGHRRALLNPFLHFTSYGQVLGASAIKVFDFSDDSTASAQEIPDYVAFPYWRYPYVFFSDKTHDKKTPWSITIIEDKSSIWANQHNYYKNALLTVTRKDTAQKMSVANLHTDTKGSGVPNNLSWTVTDWEYDVWYSVEIDNIQYRSGKTGSIQYDVFIDYKNIIDIMFPLEVDDHQNDSTFQGTLSDDNDKDSFTVDLEGKVAFSGSSQFSNMGFYIAVYSPDKQLVLAQDQAFNLDLPAGEYTLVISNCHNQRCYPQAKNYRVHIH